MLTPEEQEAAAFLTLCALVECVRVAPPCAEAPAWARWIARWAKEPPAPGDHRRAAVDDPRKIAAAEAVMEAFRHRLKAEATG